MKSIEEIQRMLLSELRVFLRKIDQVPPMDYYNEVLGDVSFLLGGVLESLLRQQFDEWNRQNWVDDCLLTKVKYDRKVLSIWGIVIWGKHNTTEQWTDPLYFEMTLREDISDFYSYKFLLGDLKKSEVSYEDFNINRNLWDAEFYSNQLWNPAERDWRYTISVIR